MAKQLEIAATRRQERAQAEEEQQVHDSEVADKEPRPASGSRQAKSHPKLKHPGPPGMTSSVSGSSGATKQSGRGKRKQPTKSQDPSAKAGLGAGGGNLDNKPPNMGSGGTLQGVPASGSLATLKEGLDGVQSVATMQLPDQSAARLKGVEADREEDAAGAVVATENAEKAERASPGGSAAGE